VLGNYKEPFWIDAESGVRTENNQLDLDKVESMLKIAKKYTRT
jgi:phosphoribosylanthranilate isomerase